MRDSDGGKIVRIGGGAAFFNDSLQGHPDMLAAGVDYVIYDYLAEVTMSLLAIDKQGSPDGFSLNFLTDMKPYLAQMRDQKVRIVTNWGGLNPQGAAAALGALLAEMGKPCTIAVVTGDDLRARIPDLYARGTREMFSNAPLPEGGGLSSVNAYLGAFAIAEALNQGADIVITGRVVDSALTLGPLIHEFGWTADDHDRLASGTLAGHLLECSTQVTGGMFTDWDSVPRPEAIGNPIALCRADGSFVVTKAPEAGGLVSIGTVAEQLVYEVSDPQRYFVPDVVCDFSAVHLEQLGPDQVRVRGARGYPPTSSYKVCATYVEGWRGQVYHPVIGVGAADKARRQADALFTRVNRILRDRNAKPLNATHLEVIGTEASYGARSAMSASREVLAMMSADHDERQGVEIFLKEQIGAPCWMGAGTATGLGGLLGRGVTPLMRVFNFLLPRSEAQPVAIVDGREYRPAASPAGVFADSMVVRPPEPPRPADIDPAITVPLVRLAWGRSGDKGNLFNVGILARQPAYYPYIAAALTADVVLDCYRHFIAEGAEPRVDRYLLPGLHGLNFVVHDSLGGGATLSPRLDPLGKAMSQLLLDLEIPVSATIAEHCRRQ